jgi:hypothetical protein
MSQSNTQSPTNNTNKENIVDQPDVEQPETEQPETTDQPEDKLPEGVKPEAFQVAKLFTSCNDVKTNMYNTYRRSQLQCLFKLWTNSEPSSKDDSEDAPSFSNVLYAMVHGLNLLKVGARQSIRWARNENRRQPARYVPKFTSSKSGEVDTDALEIAKSFTTDSNVRPVMFIAFHRQQLNALYRLWVAGQEETVKNTEFRKVLYAMVHELKLLHIGGRKQSLAWTRDLQQNQHDNYRNHEQNRGQGNYRQSNYRQSNYRQGNYNYNGRGHNNGGRYENRQQQRPQQQRRYPPQQQKRRPRYEKAGDNNTDVNAQEQTTSE